MTDCIQIGRDVAIGMRCRFITLSYNITNQEKRAGEKLLRPKCVIEEGCWIGGIVILSGVTIGRGTIVEVRSVVTCNYDGKSVYVGVSTRKIRELL